MVEETEDCIVAAMQGHPLDLDDDGGKHSDNGCAIPMCDGQGTLVCVCDNGHLMHRGCLVALTRAASSMLGLRCPLCRETVRGSENALTMLRDTTLMFQSDTRLRPDNVCMRALLQTRS